MALEQSADGRRRQVPSSDSWQGVATRAPILLFLTVFQLAAASAQDLSTSATNVGRPNIVVVVADDVGYSDLGAYGSEIRTPTIDALAERGLVFSNFHASPMCSPSRAMLLTGVDSHLAGVGSLYEATPLRHRGKPGYEGALRDDVVTVASRLQKAGYRTYLSGKWNLGHTPTTLPSARGFDRTFALDATGADNFEKKSYLPIYDEPPWFADGEPTDLPDDFYSSKDLVDRLIGFLDEDRGAQQQSATPFFAYLAFQAVHIPVQAPREFIERYEGVYDEGWEELKRRRHEGAVEKGLVAAFVPPSREPAQANWSELSEEERALYSKSMAIHAAMLEAMDFHFGRLVAYLRQEGLFDSTLFVVLSDNGPEAGAPTETLGFERWLRSVGYSRDLETLGEKGSYAFIGPHFARASASPFAYYKFHGGEGGLRVPLVISGPGVEAVGLSHSFAYVTDIAPTLLGLAGVEATTPKGKQPMSGRSLRPVFEDRQAVVYGDDDAIGFESAGHAGVFKGRYKLVRVAPDAGDGVWRLYDLEADPGETVDLATREPELFAELMADYVAYAERVGVLESPAFYSPHRQLTINYFAGQLRENVGWVFALLGSLVVTVVLVWSRRRRRSSAPEAAA